MLTKFVSIRSYSLEVRTFGTLIMSTKVFKDVASGIDGHPDRTEIYFILQILREYGSTLYVGLARDVSPTNTNFRLTNLLTRLQVALYEDLAV